MTDRWKQVSALLRDKLLQGETQVPGYGFIAYKDGQRVYSDMAGYARLAGTAGEAQKMSEDSLFRIASVSKQFTIYTVMQLVEAGRLALDEDISSYLGFSLRHPAYPEIVITVRMLANHTSGLRDGKVYSIPPHCSVAEFFKPDGMYYENGGHFSPAWQKPGDFFSYCNLNYGLLGTIIESATGERFDIYQKEHILQQLEIEGDYLPGNMPSAAFQRLGTIYRKRNPAGSWQLDGQWYPAIDAYPAGQEGRDRIALQNPYAEEINGTYSLAGYIPGTNATFFAPQGGLRISLRGMAHTLEMLLQQGMYKGQQIIGSNSFKEMTKKQWCYDAARQNGDTCSDTLLSYGLGLYQIAGDSRARVCSRQVIDLVGHTGQAFGLLSGIFFRPGTKDGFVYLMSGEALEEEEDRRSLGRFSGNFIWEEVMMEQLCHGLWS